MVFYFRWKDIDPIEADNFTCLLLAMGLEPKGNMRDYWKHSHILHTNDFFCRFMSLRQFVSILQFSHFVNDAVISATGISDPKSENYDNLHKIRPYLAAILRQSQKASVPNKQICIDEMVFRFKGRYTYRVTIKSKTCESCHIRYNINLLGTWMKNVTAETWLLLLLF